MRNIIQHVPQPELVLIRVSKVLGYYKWWTKMHDFSNITRDGSSFQQVRLQGTKDGANGHVKGTLLLEKVRGL